MKAAIAIFLGISLLLSLTACEDILRQKQRLAKELNTSVHACALLEKEIERHQEEQKKMWVANAKERFPFYYSFQLNTEIPIENQRIFKSITFSQKLSDKYIATVKIQSQHKSFKADYAIFVYDRKGLIIGKHYEEPAFLGKKIKPNAGIVKQECTIPILSNATPYYFIIINDTEI